MGQALVDYLRHGRPATSQRVVFLTAVAPFTGLAPNSVSCIVGRAARRAGLGTIHAHRLRHTAASATLNAGATLEEVAHLLRHTHQSCHDRGVRQDRPVPAGHAGSALALGWEPAMTATTTPVPPLTQLLGDYLRVRRALGFKLEGTEVLLTQFLAYLREHDADTITIEHALGFATAPGRRLRPLARAATVRDPMLRSVGRGQRPAGAGSPGPAAAGATHPRGPIHLRAGPDPGPACCSRPAAPGDPSGHLPHLDRADGRNWDPYRGGHQLGRGQHRPGGGHASGDRPEDDTLLAFLKNL